MIRKKNEKKIKKPINVKNEEELTELYLKSDVLLPACVCEKVIKVSVNEFHINPLYCESLPGYTCQCGLKYAGKNFQTLQHKDKTLLLESNIRGGISSVMGDSMLNQMIIKRYCILVVIFYMVTE